MMHSILLTGIKNTKHQMYAFYPDYHSAMLYDDVQTVYKETVNHSIRDYSL